MFAFVLVAGVYLFGQRQFQAYHERTRLENAAQLIVRSVASDLYGSDGRIEMDEGNGYFHIVSPASALYELQDGTLTRNGRSIAGEGITVSDFRIELITDYTPAPGVLPSAFQVTVRVSGNQDLRHEVIVTSRRPRQWETYRGDG